MIRLSVLRSVIPQERAQAPASPPSTDDPGRWVDLLSEREAKQLLLVCCLTPIVSSSLKGRLYRLGNLRRAETEAPTG